MLLPRCTISIHTQDRKHGGYFISCKLYLQVAALLFALDHYPENTPRHWEAIAAYIENVKPEASFEEDLETFTLTYSNVPQRIKKVFTGSANECQQLTNIIVILPIPH